MTLASLLLTVAAAASLPAAPPVERFAVVVANNQSLDEGVAALTYAVDDGAKYFELFRTLGIRTELLAAFSPEAARRFPAAAEVAVPPTRAAVLAAVERTFQQIEQARQAGATAHFYFVFTGHGNIGPNREGYVTLADARFRRTELYRDVLARSPASFNHLVLDACYAYFFVLKKGGPDKEGDLREAVRAFLRAEDLASHPNTGVLLASSSSSETHEWSRWEAGIFSHELRSGLLGGADVDGDGKVTYAEAAAFVEAANAAIDVPRARMRVFYRPPATAPDVALVDTAPLQALPTLEIEAEQAGQFHIEDARGVRVADLHPSSERTSRLALVGQAPFWVRTGEREALFPPGLRVLASQLAFGPRSAATRGSVEQTFRKHLFLLPFGPSFFRAAVEERARLEEDLRVERLLSQRAEATRPKHVAGWIGLGAGLALGAAGAVAYGMASWSHDRYDAATTREAALHHRKQTEGRLLGARVLAGAAGVLTVTGGVLLVLDWSELRSMRVQLAADTSPE